MRLAKYHVAEGVFLDLCNKIDAFVGISSKCRHNFVIEASNASLLAENLVEK